MMTMINIHQLIGILTNEPVIIIIQLLAHSNDGFEPIHWMEMDGICWCFPQVMKPAVSGCDGFQGSMVAVTPFSNYQ